MDESPGWQAIDDALARIYGDAQPVHWGTIHKFALGGPDPLDGISAYPRTEPVPHWHYVSYGMSELYTKESEDADASGWGFEFTFRLARTPGEDTPPIWPANFLQNLARYVFNSGNVFEPGHHVNANGPIAADRQDSSIRALSFVTDPELGEIGTPHGRMRFLQIVGLALEEYEALQQWNAEGLLGLLAPRMPLFVTDIGRASFLADPELAAAVERGVERDGSSSGMLYVDTAGWERSGAATTLTLGAGQAPAIGTALRRRLPYGNELMVQSDDALLVFEPAEQPGTEVPADGVLQVRVPPAALDDLVAVLRPQAGRATVPSLPGVSVEIVPTRMRDGHGNETGDVVG